MLREEINKLREGISENDLAIALAGLTKAAYEQGVQENERLKDGFSLAFWHDTFVEVKKPNSDVIYRFNINETCKHGIDDGACKECYLEGLK